MPKTLPGAIATEVSKVKASEPLIVIEVQWNESTKRFYAAENYGDAVDSLLEVSALSTIVRLGDSGSASSASATLSDTDGLIKGLLGTTDVHKVPVNIYLAYLTLPFADKYLLLSGELNTPAIWDDAARTFSFDIVSKIEDKQVGFSPEQAEDNLISEDAVGKAWPLCYGSPLHVPAVRLNEQPIGSALFHVSILSGGTTTQICSLAKQRRQYERLQEAADDTSFLDSTVTAEAYGTILDNWGSAATSLAQAVIAAKRSGASNSSLNSLITACENLQDAETDFAFWTGQSVSLQASADSSQGIIDSLNEQIINVTAQLATAIAANPQDPARIASLNASLTSLNNSLTLANQDLEGFNNAVQDADTKALAELSNIGIFTQQAQNAEDSLIRVQFPKIVIKDGEKFPQGVTLSIVVNNLVFTGQFDGEVFSTTEPTAMDPNAIVPGAFNGTSAGVIQGGIGQFTYSGPIQIQGQYGWTGRYLFYVNSQFDNLVTYTPAMFSKTGAKVQLALGGERDVYAEQRMSGAQVFSPYIRPEWLAKLRELDASGTLPAFASGLSHISFSDFTINIGDQVRLLTDLPEVYVANLLPSVEVKEVLAYRTIDGLRKLVPVPSSYYTINLSDSILGQTPTTITLKATLSSRLTENWEDGLFVSLVSIEGPNTSDALKHLVETYSDLTPDAASFATLAGFLADYPSHFCILDRPNVLSVLEDIAWQARSAVFVRNGIVFVKYLAFETTEVLTIGNNNTDFGKLQMELSSTEDIVTVFKAKWKTEYTEEEDKEVVLRNNIPKYGTVEEEYDFFIYNIERLVVKSATFWMIRYSNTWKRAKLTAMFDTFELDEFDNLLLGYGENIFGSGPIKGMVEDVTFDADTMALVYDIWTSVRCGELTQYPFAWPANADPTLEYPTAADLFSGGAAT